MDKTQILAKAFMGIRERVDALESQEMPIMTSTDDVSDPPTHAELNGIFGTPAQVADGFIGLVQDGTQGTKAWACFTINGAWWHVELTHAS